MDWFLYDKDFRHERGNKILFHSRRVECQRYEILFLKCDYLSNLKVMSRFNDSIPCENNDHII